MIACFRQLRLLPRRRYQLNSVAMFITTSRHIAAHDTVIDTAGRH